MSETIGFRQNTEFLGRNGLAKMAGIHVSRQGNDLYVAPVTSRSKVGRAYMLVPMAMAPEVARAILRVCGAAHKAVVEVRGGVAEVTSCPPGVEVKIIDHDNAGTVDRRAA